MQSENRMFDDLVKLVNGAAGTMAGVGREAGETAREHARSWIGGLDFVTREEFDAVKAMAAAARDENDALTARLDAVEAKLAAKAATPASTAPKPATATKLDKPAAGPSTGVPDPASGV